MFRAIGLSIALLVFCTMGKGVVAQVNKVEGKLIVVDREALGDVLVMFPQAQRCGKYFVEILKPGSQARIGFMVPIAPNVPIPTIVIANLLHISIIVDEGKEIPTANTELSSGFLKTRMSISAQDLRESPCLTKAPKG